MANQATFTLRSQWAWRDDTGYGPDHGAGSPNGELTETGPATAVGFDGGFPPGGIGDGGVLGNFYSATPLLFHFGITDDAPYYGDNDPGLKALENSGSGGELGLSSASDEAAFTDYVTNTSAAPITMKFTMDVNAVVTGVGAGVGGGFSALDLNELSNTVTVSPDFNFSSGSDSVAATFTLPAGHTAVVEESLDVESTSVWEWPTANSAPDGTAGSIDLYSHQHIDEVDSNGVPIAGNPNLKFDSGILFSSLACFAGGTRIATPDGEIAVEHLAAGMSVVVPSGAARIKWVGHRRVDCRRHPHPGQVVPIRVRAGTFGPRAPHRDLWLSPDHAIFVDGVLIPVRHLIDGAAIAPDPRDVVTYWHIELDLHDALLAEGLTCESFLDTGNRHAFENGGPAIALHPDFASHTREAHAFAAVVVVGPVLDRVRARLRQRSTATTGGAHREPRKAIASPRR